MHEVHRNGFATNYIVHRAEEFVEIVPEYLLIYELFGVFNEVGRCV